MKDISIMVKERNEAFLSLDKEKIVAFCKKYNMDIPNNEYAFWCGVHKVICHIKCSEEEKARSVKWLYEHGSSPEIFYDRSNQN